MMRIIVDEHTFMHGDEWGYKIFWNVRNECWCVDIRTPDGWEGQKETFNAMRLYGAIEYAKTRINIYRVLYDCTFIQFQSLIP